jgi:hypothetical protein
MAALSCIDLIIYIGPKMSETRLKLKNIGVGFIQIGTVKSHCRSSLDQRFLETSKIGRRLRSLQIFDRVSMTCGCTGLNETNANIFCLESSFTHFWI